MNATDIILCISLLLYAFLSEMAAAFISTEKFRFSVDETPAGFRNTVKSIFRKKSTPVIRALLIGSIVSLVVFGIFAAQKTAVWASLLSCNDGFIVFFQIIIAFLILLIFIWPVHLFFMFSKMDIKKVSGRNHLSKGYLDYFIQQSIEELSEDSEMETEVKLFQNALDFSTVKLRNCIVPRTEIVAVDITETAEKLKELFIESGLSKIIVYKDDIDEVIGYIHSSEMFRHSDDWAKSINQIPIVPDTMAAHKLMHILMQEKKSIAVAVDEFGGTAGIVTLEDLVEEIFGDIEDEYDSQSHLAKEIGENEYIFSGRNEVGKLNELFDLDLPESDKYITLAGLILEHYQKFPKLNEEIQIGKYLFKILRLTSTKIDLVKMTGKVKSKK